MIVYAPAKINIGLKVLDKRKDGYHNLDSLFYPIPLFDIIEVIKSINFEIENTGIPVDGSIEDNLIFKAWDLMRIKHHISGIHVHLHKRIPMGAGLGGGSSDASSVLKCINELFELNIKASTLEDYALELGADCPFFIKGNPSRVQGIGDKLQSVSLDLSGLFIALIKPDIHISTGQAYTGVKLEGEDAKLNMGVITNIMDWNSEFANSFEYHLFDLFPVLDEIKNQLVDEGAFYASMSGSGATIYGLFKKKPRIHKAWTSHFVWIKQL